MVILKYIWQLPQNLLGLLYCWYLIIRKQLLIATVEECGKARIYTKKSPGCVTLGEYVFLAPLSSNIVISHEIGHTKQSLILGPLYLIIIGLPSIVWAATHKVIAPNKSYYWFYTESTANKLGNVNIE